MGRLTELIPRRFAQECATAGFLSSCKSAVGELAAAESLPTALGVLGGAAVGPLAFLGIYAGGAFLQWKADERKAESARAEFRELHQRLGRIEDGVNEQKELAGLLEELLKRDGEMRERLERAEQADKPLDEAAALVLRELLDELGVEVRDGFEGVRIFLSNIFTVVTEGFERVEAKQDLTHGKLDANAAKLDKALRLLEELGSQPAAMSAGSDAPPERPPLSDEDRELFNSAMPFADALPRYLAAVRQGNDDEAGELEPEVERKRSLQRIQEDFLFQRARGDRHFFADRVDDAIAPYRAALDIKPDEPSVLNKLAMALMYARHSADHGAGLAEAERLLTRALDLRRALHPGDHPDVATSLNNLATVRQAGGNAKMARPLYEEALEMRRRLEPGDDRDTAGSLNSVAYVYEELGRTAEAEQMYAKALEMRKRLFRGDHRDVAQSLNNLAFVRILLGRAAAAEPMCQEALAMRRRLFPGDHPDVAASMNNLAYGWAKLGRVEKAEAKFLKVLAMNKRLYTGPSRAVATSMNNLARVWQMQGRAAEAEPMLAEALEMLKRLYKNGHSLVANSLYNLADVRGDRGKWSEALGPAEEAVAMGRRCLPEGHPDLVRYEQMLAAIRQKLGRE